MRARLETSRSVQHSRINIGVFFVLILVILLFVSNFTGIVPKDEYLGERRFKISFHVRYINKNGEGCDWNISESDELVGLFMNNSWQTVYLTSSSHPIYMYDVDIDGNLVAFLDLPDAVKPGENLSYEVSYQVVLRHHSAPNISESASGTLNDISESLKFQYCTSAGPWILNDSKLVDLAYEIAGNETVALKILRSFIEWILTNVRYSSAEVPRYPNETLSERAGDCDDQANLLVALCRIVGIPAHLQIGCIYMPSRTADISSYWGGHLIVNLTRIGWHGWAMVFIPPWGWLPVDLTYVSSSDLSADPLNAILKSAVFAHPTVQFANITRSDYVGEARLIRDYLEACGFYIVESDIMDEVLSGQSAYGLVGAFSGLWLIAVLLVSCRLVFSSIPSSLGQVRMDKGST